MEFEKDTPASPEQIALADAPKVTLQPLNSGLSSEPLNTNHTHQNEATFSFESEDTSMQQSALPQQPRVHTGAALIAAGCVLVFMAVLGLIYVLR